MSEAEVRIADEWIMMQIEVQQPHILNIAPGKIADYNVENNTVTIEDGRVFHPMYADAVKNSLDKSHVRLSSYSRTVNADKLSQVSAGWKLQDNIELKTGEIYTFDDYNKSINGIVVTGDPCSDYDYGTALWLLTIKFTQP